MRIIVLIEETGSTIGAFLLALVAGIASAFFLVSATLVIAIPLVIEVLVCTALSIFICLVFYRRCLDKVGDTIHIAMLIIKIIVLTVLNYKLYKAEKPNSLGLLVGLFSLGWSYAVAYFSHMIGLDVYLKNGSSR